jgi:hypothetical protein
MPVDMSQTANDDFLRELPWNPQPLRRYDQPEPYPVERLPPIIRDAVEQVVDYVQAPVALVAGCALSAVSAAVQTQFSVSRDERLHGPASLFFLTIAESGERKSTVDKLFMQPLHDWEAHQRKEQKRWERMHREEMEAWESEGRQGERPEDPPIVPRMLRGDDTAEALIAHLDKYPIAAVVSAEAGVIFGSHSMKAENAQRNMGLLNQIWDGGPIREARVGRGESIIESVRGTMGLMLQPDVLMKFSEKTDGLARGIGFFARFLMCHPATTQGTRLYKRPLSSMSALKAFQVRVAQLLLIPAAFDEMGRLDGHRVRFDPAAERAWIMFHDEVEELVGGDREYSTIGDVASKAAENAARLACCLHVFATYAKGLSPIAHGTIDSACAIMRWYLDEAVRFGRSTDVTEEVRNAETLERWLAGKVKEAPKDAMTVRMVRQKGPGMLRGGKRIDDAIDLLQDLGRIRVTVYPGNKSRYITIAPQVVKEWS